MRQAILAALLSTTACASTGAQSVSVHAPAEDDGRANVAPFEAAEAHAIDMLVAVDPRLSRRFDAQASAEALQSIGTAAVLAEDATAVVRGGALDLFAFKARSATLARLTADLAKAAGPLPDVASGAIARPRLERELLVRAVAEERARVAEESPLGDAAAPLVRAMVELWTPGATAAEWRDTDAWASAHLLQIRDSYAAPPARTAASDLEPALFELEKLLVPMQFGKSAFALTQVHAALDADDRPRPAAMSPDELASRARVHLGIATTAALATELGATADTLKGLVDAALGDAKGDAREAIEKEARTLLLADAKCGAVAGSRMRSAAPPAERNGVCNVLTLTQRTDARAASLMALHDEVVVAEWTLTPPSPRAHLATLSVRVDDDLADTLKEMAAARPLTPLAAGVVAAFLYRSPADAPRLAAAWQAFGEAPLDVAERELTSGATAASPPRASLRP
jgi:hypothetical protein